MPIVCPFCEKSNSPDAKFCSACGGALHLAPCPNCGAVNDVSAASCFQCGGMLAGQNTDTAPVESAEAESAPATARRTRGPAWLAAVVAILGGLGALGYYALPPRTEVAPTAVPLPAREPPVEARPPQLDQGAITPVLPERPAAAPVAVPPIAVPPPRPDRKPVESIKPPAAKAPVRRPQAASRVGAARLSGTSSCTAQALALGLCPEPAATPNEPQAPAAPPVSAATCTQAAAALGLCAPALNDRGN
jgi:hypothetical protein